MSTRKTQKQNKTMPNMEFGCKTWYYIMRKYARHFLIQHAEFTQTTHHLYTNYTPFDIGKTSGSVNSYTLEMSRYFYIYKQLIQHTTHTTHNSHNTYPYNLHTTRYRYTQLYTNIIST